MHLRGRALTGAQLLAAELPLKDFSPADVECYARGDDLIAIYAESPQHPFRMQLYWRAIQLQGGAVGLELVAAVQTNLLDSWPEVAARTRLEATALRVLANSTDNFEAVSTGAPTGVQSLERDRYRGCFRFGLAEHNSAYAEMVHPVDFHVSTLTAESNAGSGANMTLRHELFAHRLEKGVILKARVRGLFLPGDESDARLRELYEMFARSEPPLTT